MKTPPEKTKQSSVSGTHMFIYVSCVMSGWFPSDNSTLVILLPMTFCSCLRSLPRGVSNNIPICLVASVLWYSRYFHWNKMRNKTPSRIRYINTSWDIFLIGKINTDFQSKIDLSAVCFISVSEDIVFYVSLRCHSSMVCNVNVECNFR